MEPTPHLRFVERDGRKILQQWWTDSWSLQFGARELGQHGYGSEPRGKTYGEWRDIPLAAEGE